MFRSSMMAFCAITLFTFEVAAFDGDKTVYAELGRLHRDEALVRLADLALLDSIDAKLLQDKAKPVGRKPARKKRKR